MSPKKIIVTKASGEKEPYNPRKVRRAILRTGADKKLAEKILKEVRQELYNGISTGEIFKKVFQLLNKHHPPAGSRFDLKRSIMRIGPAGYPFETFFSEVLEEHGYVTVLRQELQGHCVPHEIDVIAKKGNKTFMIECKYHNSRGTKTHVDDALYTWARFLDLRRGAEEGKCKGVCQDITQVWLATNTKFTSEVIDYAKCVGMKLTGWKYPRRGSLRQLIEKKRLYPISILNSVNKHILKKMFKADLMLAKDVLKYSPNKLQSLTGISKKRIDVMVEEAEGILKS